jgi:hypothetical protein
MNPDYEVSFTPLCVGWHRAVRVLLLGITRERRLKPPGPDLIGGGQPLSGPMERHLLWLPLTHIWLPRLHSDPDSAQRCLVSDH